MDSCKEVSYYIDGGVGRIIALSGVFKNNPNNLITSYPEVFKNNPNIQNVIGTNTPYLVEDYAWDMDIKVIDPYVEYEFYHNKKHLTTIFNYLINGVMEYCQPKIYANPKKGEDFIIAHQIDKFVLFQPFGREFNKDLSWRSMDVEFAYQTILRCIKAGYQVVYIKSAMDPKFSFIDGVIEAEEQTVDLETLFGLASIADKIIGIDSMLNHLSAGVNKQALIFWTGTDVKNFGYDSHINVKVGEPMKYIFHIPLNNTDRLKYNPYKWHLKFLDEIEVYLKC